MPLLVPSIVIVHIEQLRPGEEAHEAKSCLVGKREVFPPSQGLPEGEAETGGGGWLSGMPTGVSASRRRLQFELQTEII